MTVDLEAGVCREIEIVGRHGDSLLPKIPDHFESVLNAYAGDLGWVLEKEEIRVQNVEFVQPTRTISNYSYHVKSFTGPGFLCAGDSHRFIDPIFSFGVFFALQEAEMAAAAIKRSLDKPSSNGDNPFSEYEQRLERGQQIVEDLITCFWEYPLAFQRMVRHTHTADIIDIFAGRIYDEEDEQTDCVQTMRRMLAKLN